MIHKDIVELSASFHRLELHAARSGRETSRVLMKVLDESQQTSISALLQELHENISFLLGSLPPYAPPLQSINRLLLAVENSQIAEVSIAEMKRDIATTFGNMPSTQASHAKIAQNLLKFLPENATFYTHTLSETVLGVLLELHRLGKVSLVNVTESRPNNDGWETARRLAEQGVRVHLAIDAAMPEAIQTSHLMLSGAEIVRPDGSVVGKIGAFIAALLCQVYEKPLYIVADSSKFSNIPWQDFCLSEIRPDALGIGFSHPFLDVVGTYFDITPARLIQAYATEIGVIQPGDLQSFFADKKVSAWLMQLANRSIDVNFYTLNKKGQS
jgi:translation initiation factor 2B subunit (eIF-2B alpha/beta/delta family)